MNRIDDLRASITESDPLEGVERKPIRTHCKRGHEMTPDNTYMNKKKGGRYVYPACKTCSREQVRRWQAENPERLRELNKRSNSKKVWTPELAERARVWRLEKYGLTPETFRKLWDAQGGRCAICELELRERAPRDERGVHSSFDTAAVDHCHATGVVRGILCLGCNRALGYVLDKPETLEKAARYLRGFR